MDSQTNRMQKLNKYKSKIIGRLIQSQELCKALYYQESNFLELPDIDPYILLEGNTKRIYSYKFVPDSTNDQNAYITMEYLNAGARKRYKRNFIQIFCLVHKSNEETDIGWNRSDYILHLIDQQVNQMRGIGIGKLEFYDSDNVFIRINDAYYVRYNMYRFYDFN
ncbi:MAG: hypothetical protein GX053_15425 [Tissierella sp.]|nr:hypothetical protein [Tissierella sp.]